jgi:hypothetical protein
VVCLVRCSNYIDKWGTRILTWSAVALACDEECKLSRTNTFMTFSKALVVLSTKAAFIAGEGACAPLQFNLDDF